MDSQFQLAPLGSTTPHLEFVDYTEAESEAEFISTHSSKPYVIWKTNERPVPIAIAYNGIVYENETLK